MRIAFAGTPEFARIALASLHAAGHEIVLVLTQPDRPAGRGMKLHSSAVKLFALDHGFAIGQPRGLRLDGRWAADAQAARAALVAAAPDAAVVAAYGLILPQWLLGLPPRGCLNIHASLLPRWRGAAPIQRAIEAGDPATGVTIIRMDAGLDTGPMLLAERQPIEAGDSAATLTDKLAELGGRLMVEALARVACGGLDGTPQPTEGVTYAHKIDKAEAVVDWSAPAALIERRLRAFDPFPGASSVHAGTVLKLWRGRVAEPTARSPAGTVVGVDERGLRVACGEGILVVTELQRAGGPRLPAARFLARHPLPVGSRLGCAVELPGSSAGRPSGAADFGSDNRR